MPCSRARSMIRCESGSSVCGPKFIVPRTRRDTDRPLRPRWVYSMPRTYAADRRLRRSRRIGAGQSRGPLLRVGEAALTACSGCWVLRAVALVVRHRYRQRRHARAVRVRVWRRAPQLLAAHDHDAVRTTALAVTGPLGADVGCGVGGGAL